MTAMPGRLMAPRMPDFLRRGRAACGDYDPELFYPTSEANMAAVEMAKSVCRRCPVRADCLSYALETGDDWGIWAGTTARERRRIRLGVA